MQSALKPQYADKINLTLYNASALASMPGFDQMMFWKIRFQQTKLKKK